MKTQIKRWLARAAAVTVAFALCACVTDYAPDQSAAQQMSVEEARNILKENTQSPVRFFQWDGTGAFATLRTDKEISNIELSENSITVVLGARKYRIPLKNLAPSLKHAPGSLEKNWVYLNENQGFWGASLADDQNARSVLDALEVLKRAAITSDEEPRLQEVVGDKAGIKINPQTADPGQMNSANIDLAFWESIKSSSVPSDFQAYLDKFPNGNFSSLAHSRLITLNEQTSEPAKPISPLTNGKFDFGNYHALVIGINKYRSVPQLKTADTDAKAVAELLSKDYGFKVTLLLDPTRDTILNSFDDLRRSLTEKDNLIIYFAGHGYLDTDSDRGYWLPVDAEADHRANWLSNSDLTDMLKATLAKHVLVVADSCYSGTLTRSLSVQMTVSQDLSRLAQKRARTALTSGGLEPVEDAGGGRHSVFAKAFLDALQSNTGVIDMSQIFSSMRREVMLNSQQTPQYGDIRQTGHEGGDFIFARIKTSDNP